MQENRSSTLQGNPVAESQKRKPLMQEPSMSQQERSAGMPRQERPVRAQQVAPEKVRRGAPVKEQQRVGNLEAKRQQVPVGQGVEAGARAKKLGYSPFSPLFVLALTIMAMVVFQTIQLSKDREVLVKVKQNQEAAVSESKKVRSQFESIAKSTGQLAVKGNTNAQAIVEQLRKQGITINLNAGSTQ